jgi:outer membrane protein assembly factor BamE (lipoprotein component of BamABCDE complex)
MNKLLISLLILFFLYGCGQKLNALITISKEKEEQSRYIQAQDAKLALLLKDIKQGDLKKGLTAREVIRIYGEPVLVKEENSRQVFIYRDTVEFFPKQKIYLYFDSDNRLSDFTLEEARPAALNN